MMKRLIDISSEELIYSTRSLQYLLTNGRGNQKRKVLVNGSPKTGTTWMLKLINSIPGYREVGNFDGEINKYESVKPGEVVHGHDWYTEDMARILHEGDIKAILMMRDPRDQLISRVFHIRRGNTHVWSDKLMELDLDVAISLCIEGREGLPGTRTMIELTQSWLDSEFDFECVRYEDLLSEPANEFRRVLGFLEIDLPDDLVTTIVERNQFERLSGGRRFWRQARKPGQADPNSHFRKGIVGDWRNYLNESHKSSFKEIAGDKLIELGYEDDLNW
jgi:hypothetical protein